MCACPCLCVFVSVLRKTGKGGHHWTGSLEPCLPPGKTENGCVRWPTILIQALLGSHHSGPRQCAQLCLPVFVCVCVCVSLSLWFNCAAHCSSQRGTFLPMINSFDRCFIGLQCVSVCFFFASTPIRTHSHPCFFKPRSLMKRRAV